MRRGALIAALAFGAAVIAAPTAQATDVDVSGPRLEVSEHTASETNSVSVSSSGADLSAADPVSGVFATGTGCANFNPALALCNGGGITELSGDLGAGDDTLTLDVPLNARLDGGSGADSLTTSGGRDVLAGKEGNDTARAGAGDDELLDTFFAPDGGGDDAFFGESGDDLLVGGSERADGVGADVLDGGPGIDTVDYSERLQPLTITVGESSSHVADDGGLADVSTSGPARRDDVIDVEIVKGGMRADRITGASGDEQLFGGPDDDVLIGGDGRDRLDGGQGNDALDGGAGPDELVGGPGSDTATYAPRTTGVRVTLDDLANDGDPAVFESDLVDPSVENLVGGSGPDELIGSSGGNSLHGDAGSDVLQGRGGDDLLDGGPGDDAVTGETGDDGVVGGPGNDQLAGGSGDDWLDGAAGNDRIDVRDGARDVVVCGSGRDTVLADPLDIAAGDCEAVARAMPPGSVAEAVTVSGPARLSRTGPLRVAIRCPESALGGCGSGRIRLSYSIRSSRSSRPRRVQLRPATFTAAAGARLVVRLPVSRSQRRDLARVRTVTVVATYRGAGRVPTGETTKVVPLARS